MDLWLRKRLCYLLCQTISDIDLRSMASISRIGRRMPPSPIRYRSVSFSARQRGYHRVVSFRLQCAREEWPSRPCQLRSLEIPSLVRFFLE